ncbi:zf-C3HC-domain-containing protein [Agrocybe pediades]|nr:zf-C3HC-domain-containing protein [Agrocybe pediades]
MTETPSSLPTISETTPETGSTIRATKRKLDDAFQILDNAVAPSNIAERPAPPKKANTIRSLYSTLSKYGIKSGSSKKQTSSDITKNTPHLSAILARAAERTKSSFTFKFPSQNQTPAPPLSATAEYRPSSLTSFISRLATYKLATYGNKHSSIDAVAASRCGWINDGKDRLVCGLCNASWVVAGKEGLSRDAANSLVEKQRVSLVEAHKNGCPWRTRQCDDSIYCIPLHSPGTMIKSIKENAVSLDPVIKDIIIKHPLTASQLNSLLSTISSYTPPSYDHSSSIDTTSHSPTDGQDIESSELSESAILASLFGWSLVPPPPLEPLRRSSTRASSVMSTAPSSPSPSCAASVALPSTPRRSTDSMAPSFRSLAPTSGKDLLQCGLCQRRLGLWTFSSRSSTEDAPPDSQTTTTATNNDSSVAPPSTPARPTKALPRRSLDLLKEHRSYCPYVVRSTIVPSLPVPPLSPGTPARSNSRDSISTLSHYNGPNKNGALEGWRAVLSVVLRYGMARKQGIEYNFLAPKDPAQGNDDAMDVDNVKAMVSGVKARGGKDLLKYVKGLLG